jgi:Na+/proline symporter
MNTMGIIVIIFTLLTMLIGFWTYYQVKGRAVNYYKAGAMMPVWVVGFTLCAQAFDANGSIGTTGMSYADGFWTGASIPIGLAACLFITGLFFAKPIHRMNLMTLADFYHRRYSQTTETLAVLSMLASNIILIAGNLAGLGLLYGMVFGVDYLPMLLLVGGCILAYAITGGLFASIATSVFQVAVFSIAMLLAFVWLTMHYGWSSLMADVPETHKYFVGLTSPEHGAYLNWAALLSLGIGDVIAIDFMQRVISARSPETAQKGCFMGGLMTLIVGIPTAFIGLYAFHIKGLASDNVLVNLAMNNLPFFIGALLILGIIAASMSTAAGVILALANMLTRNLMQRYTSKVWDDHILLHFSRLISIPTMLAAVIFAYYIPEPGLLLILAFDVVLAGCFIPFVLGIYWNKANTAAAISAIIIGAITRLALHFTIPESLAGFDTMIPPVVSLFVFVSVALLTQASSPPNITVFAHVPTEKELVEAKD